MKRECLQRDDGTVEPPPEGSRREALFARHAARQDALQDAQYEEQLQPLLGLVSSSVIRGLCTVSATATCACSISASQGLEIDPGTHNSPNDLLCPPCMCNGMPSTRVNHLMQTLSFVLQLDYLDPALHMYVSA